MSTLNTQKPIITEATETVVKEAADEERGSIETMKKLSDWITDSNEKLRKQLDARDVRMARLHIGELAGQVKQLANHAGLLAKDLGLPEYDL